MDYRLLRNRIYLSVLLLFFIGNITAARVMVDGVMYELKKLKHTATVVSKATDTDAQNFEGIVNIPSVITVEGEEYVVVSVEKKAFYAATSLIEVTLPPTVEEIGRECFSLCTKIERIFFLRDTPAKIGADAFEGVNPDCTVIVKQGAMDKFRKSDVWYKLNYAEEGAYFVEGRHWINGIMYEMKGNEATVVESPRESPYEGEIYIPSSVDLFTTNYHVTAIGDSAFFDCYSLTALSIPASIREIRNYAFSGSSIKELDIPEGQMRRIGDGAFLACKNLKSITIRFGLEELGNDVFKQCYSLANVSLPNSINKVGNDCFVGSNVSQPICTDRWFLRCPRKNVKSLTIRDGITQVAGGAFSGCEIETINLPSSVTHLGCYALSGCKRLKRLFVNANTLIQMENDCITPDVKNLMVVVSEKTVKAYKNHPEWGKLNVVERGNYFDYDLVEEYGFWYCLTAPHEATLVARPDGKKYKGEIAIQDSIMRYGITYYVRKIGDRVFANCDSLTALILSDSLTHIGQGAFYNCSLKEFELPRTLRYIGDYAFSHSKMDSIHIPQHVHTIGNGAFSECTKLQKVTLGKGLRYIGEYAFENCAFAGITLPDSMKRIGDYAFRHCENLTTVKLPRVVEEVGLGVFTGSRKIARTLSTESILIRVPENAKGHYSVPSNIVKIAGEAFADCVGLTSVSIPSSVTEVGDNAFENCSLSSAVSSKNVYAYAAKNQAGVISLAQSIDYIAGGAFKNRSGVIKVNLPDNLKHIGAFAFGGLDELEEDMISNKEYIAHVKPSFNGYLHVNDSIKYIAGGAFANCQFNAFDASSLVNIGDYAFYNASVKVLNMERSPLKHIGRSIFENAQISKVVLPDSIREIPQRAFYQSTVSTIKLPSMLETISSFAFFSTKLTSVTIPSSVKKIESRAFGNSPIKSVTIKAPFPPSLGVDVFDKSKLTSIIVPKESVDLYKALWSEYSSIISY